MESPVTSRQFPVTSFQSAVLPAGYGQLPTS